MSNSRPSPPAISPSDFFSTLREIVDTYQAFHRAAANHVQQFGLSIEQFDVIATLGNTPDMKIHQLKQKNPIAQEQLLFKI